MQIDLSKVVKVYSGRPGCMCGCRGKWTYASEQAFRESLGDDVSCEPGDVSMRSVKIITGKVQRAASVARVDMGDGGACYYIEGSRILSRILAVYTRE